MHQSVLNPDSSYRNSTFMLVQREFLRQQIPPLSLLTFNAGGDSGNRSGGNGGDVSRGMMGGELGSSAGEE